MNSLTDQQLLRDYTEGRSEAAFAELVRRHIDFVYSAALRIVRDAHLAEDVTQAVFVAFAQNASELTDRPVLSGWLHRTARNLAAKAVRSDVRRRAREQEAAVMNELLSAESDTIWERIAPHLDAALGELSEADRDALLLRYFERKSAHEIAQTLGVSDEAAQKRVSRTVERLREFFSKRGVTVGATGLVAVISANAVQAAPVGLALTISSVAALTGSTIVTSATATAAKAIAMTTLQKTLITATLVAAVGTGIYELRQASTLRTQVQILERQQEPLTAQVQELSSRLKTGTDALAALKQENGQLRRNTTELPRLRDEVSRMRRDLKELAESSAKGNDPFVQKALQWKANEAKLRQLFDDRPNQRVPEMQLLGDDDWLGLAKNEDLDSEAGIRKALSGVRRYAKNIFVNKLSDAFGKFVNKNNGRLPDDIYQLKPYFDKPAEDAMLGQYKLLHAGKISDVPRGEWAITDTVVDAEYDTPWGIGPGKFGPMRASPETLAALVDELDSAFKGFSAANNGKAPTDLTQLMPYINTPAQTNALNQLDRMGVSLGGK